MSLSKGKALLLSLRRVGVALVLVVGGMLLMYAFWKPGLDVRDGHDDRWQNAIWLAHGWMGGDEWFYQNHKTNEFSKYREPARVRELAAKLGNHGIRDVFPHLCPVGSDGSLPPVNPKQVEDFLDAFEGFRVMPWVGGPNGANARLHISKWRASFVAHICELLKQHSRFAGIHLNVEPLPSGDKDFLVLLDEVRAALPPDKILSVAAYPPPTRWHPFPDVHWEESYFREVAKRCDQVVVMMYDAGQRLPKTYQRLMADWTVDVLKWSEGKSLLLGVPTYEDAEVEYHHASVENITNALLGIHAGLSRNAGRTNYQGLAIYSEWETSDAEWHYLGEHFLRARANK